MNELDTKALELALIYRKSEAELLKVVLQIDDCKLFYRLGFNSLFAYITERLKLTPAVAYNLIGVARKSKEVPELKEQVFSGKMSVSKARKLTSVINKENQKSWIESALSKDSRSLEKEIALASPKNAVQERVQYVSQEQEKHESVKIKQQMARIQLQIGVSEKIMLKLRRAQDLESQKNKENCGLEETLEALLDVYLEKRDPLKKAIRQKNRGKLAGDCNLNENESSKHENEFQQEPAKNRDMLGSQLVGDKFGNKNKKNSMKLQGGTGEKYNTQQLICETQKSGAKPSHSQKIKLVTDKLSRNIPAQTIHKLQLRDESQCTYLDRSGRRCSSRRYLEVHHIKPFSQGGGHELGNLILLCSGHHRAIHLSVKC